MSMVTIQLTSTTSSMIEDVIGQGCHPLSGALLCELPLHQGGTCSVLWHLSSGKLPGPTNLSLDRSISMTTSITMKSSSKCTTRSLRLLEGTIGWRPIICLWLCPARLDLGSSICPKVPSTTGTHYVPCSSITFRAHTSVRSPLIPWRPSSRSMIKVSGITWNVSAIPGMLS
jgi:hypothetical protein